ncbi:MAG: putative aminopeptidase [Steroidobacteraceae bacterium]|nr:putative aminopeptidase [Steroidobacteraceae bacterium]
MANVGMVGLDWQERVDWDRLRKYRLERARERMKAHGLGAMLLMYDENVRYVTSTLTPGWNRLKPGLRYALLCGRHRFAHREAFAVDSEGKHSLFVRLDQGRCRPRFDPAGHEIHQRDQAGNEKTRRRRHETRRRLH